MSLDATRWAWQQIIKPASVKIVLLSLADRAGESHECYPSTIRLEKDTGLYRETIFEAIKSLEKIGLISVKRELGKGNKFTLIGVENRHSTSSEMPTSRQIPTSSKKPTPTSRHLPTTQSVNADTYQSVNADTNLSIEPINNLSIEPTNSKKQKKSQFFEGVKKQIVDDYLAVRKSKKAPPVSQTVFDGLLREATKAGCTLEQALTTCIERNWVGFNASWVEPARRQNFKDKGSIAEQNKASTEAARIRLFGNIQPEKEVQHATE